LLAAVRCDGDASLLPEELGDFSLSACCGSAASHRLAGSEQAGSARSYVQLYLKEEYRPSTCAQSAGLLAIPAVAALFHGQVLNIAGSRATRRGAHDVIGYLDILQDTYLVALLPRTRRVCASRSVNTPSSTGPTRASSVP